MSSLENRVNISTNYIQSHFQPITKSQAQILSIGGPEISRYNEIQNLLETEFLELAYVSHGTLAADFSIGVFQMKPSFIEHLEEIIRSDCELASFNWLAEYNLCDIKTVRKERLQRITQSNYMLGYLSAFSRYCIDAYNLYEYAIPDQIQFIATAYNMGFGYTKKEIIEYQQKAFFPYGSAFTGQQVAYGQLSLSIYEKLIATL